MVLCKEFAGRAEAAYLFHIRCRRRSASAEEFGGLVFFKGMTLVVLAYRAVLPADLPVLFGILYNRFAGTKHALVRWAMMNNRFFYWVFRFGKNSPALITSAVLRIASRSPPPPPLLYVCSNSDSRSHIVGMTLPVVLPPSPVQNHPAFSRIQRKKRKFR